MSVLAGPFTIACLLLMVGGLAKAVRPGDTANALDAVGFRVRRRNARAGVRVGSAVETAIGAAALLTGSWWLVALVALSYAGFAAFVVRALRRGAPISSCGCFGKVDTPPSTVHVALDVVFAAVATAAAVAGNVALPDVLSDQPLAGVPFALLAVLGCYLVFVAFTLLPKTSAAVRGV
jgi:hypothetical protein